MRAVVAYISCARQNTIITTMIHIITVQNQDTMIIANITETNAAMIAIMTVITIMIEMIMIEMIITEIK